MAQAMRLELTGRVQGCGVRPALVRLAIRHGLVGWVANVGDRVRLHIQGEAACLGRFCAELPAALPGAARLQALKSRPRPVCRALNSFVIRDGRAAVLDAMPDLPVDSGICNACCTELFDPASARFRYPFNGCTQCGPRLGLMRAWPFIRGNTSYASFAPCEGCVAEKSDPFSHRYGEELISCPACGPSLRWINPTDPAATVNDAESSLARASGSLLRGGLIAVKGMGGFHLMCRADALSAVAALRRLKARPYKPLALLVRDLEMAESLCVLTPDAADCMSGPDRPIVIMPARDATLTATLAPGLDRLGLMLPATPVQALLSSAVGVPLVATSANRRGEPLAACVDELLGWLGGAVEGILDHSLTIVLPQDDSVVIADADLLVCVRRGRGRLTALSLPDAAPVVLRGEGAWNKNVLAWARSGRAMAGPPTGDRGVVAAEERRDYVASHLQGLLGLVSPMSIGEVHPDSEDSGVMAFHHRAHLAALLLDAGVPATPSLVACWDGLGYGEDGSWWGSSCFLGGADGWREVSRLLDFPLPGGNICQREPWRVAAACLRASGISAADVDDWLYSLDSSLPSRWQWFGSPNTSLPACSSLGRFFEAMACIIMNDPVNHHEGDLASRLEALARAAPDEGVGLPVPGPGPSQPRRLDWRSLVVALWACRSRGQASLALGLHRALARMLINEATSHEVKTVGMTGGCFQNMVLLQTLRHEARRAGMESLVHRSLPPNDESLAWGQLLLAKGLATGSRVVSGGT